MVCVVDGACNATDQIPSSELAEEEEPENKRSIWQSKSGTVPVSEKTTFPAISNGLLGAIRAPSPSNAPCERMSETLSSGTSRAAEKRHRCSGNARNTSCPARSTIRIPGSRRVSPRSGVVQASLKSTLSVKAVS